ncbi:MAG: hypothetical protein ACLFVU_10525 [Phycisphaerae bacterium]
MRTRIALIALLIVSVGLLTACDTDDETTVRGKGGRSLELEKPEPLIIARGETKTVEIDVEKSKEVEDTIKVTFENLPNGVTVTDMDKEVIDDDIDYTFRAAADAEMVSGHMVKVTATAGELSVTKNLEISVNAAE